MGAVFLGPRDYVNSPEAMARTWTRAESDAYVRWLATRHYENFHVVTFLLPKRLHQDFYSVYAFCRWADDLGDEIGDPVESLRLLAWWKGELDAMFQGVARHPVFVSLRDVVKRHSLSRAPFEDLVDAFVQDQTVTRYRSWPDLFDYCRRSANPVGRLLLALCGYRDDTRVRLSDATCTALQLANFWQDVSIDLEKDRVYIPTETLERHGSTLADVQARRFTPSFREAMRECVLRARTLFTEGLPLAGMVDRRLALDILLFSRGGLRVLDKIEAQNYDVLARRPAISKAERAWLLISTAVHSAFRRAAA